MNSRLCSPETSDRSSFLWQLETDLGLDGRRSGGRLVVEPDRIWSAASNDGEAEFSIPAQEIERYRIAPGMGCGVLQARWKDDWYDLARFTNRHAKRFETVLEHLEMWRLGRTPSPVPCAPLDGPRCEKCDLPLERDPSDCPRCMPRRATWTRVREMLQPLQGGIGTLTVLTLFGVAADLAPPKLQQYLVDRVLADGDVRAGGPVSRQELLTVLALIVAGLAVSRVAVMLAVARSIYFRVTRYERPFSRSARSDKMRRRTENPSADGVLRTRPSSAWDTCNGVARDCWKRR